jgi:hypothetical protein
MNRFLFCLKPAGLVVLLALSVLTVGNLNPATAQEQSPKEQAPQRQSPQEQAAQPAGISFERMPVDQVRSELLQWLAQSGVDRSQADQITLAWADDSRLSRLSGEELLDLLIAAFATADRATQRLVDSSRTAGPLEEIVYDGVREVQIYQHQVRLFRARWLTQHRYFDEALSILEALPPDQVVDPAGLFFYRAVCQSQLLQGSQAVDSLTLLLNHTLDVPERFRVVAEMMKQQLGDQSDSGLELVAKVMSDVERRIDLGRSGEKVQEQESEVIRLLDKLLEDMDNQNQQQQQGGGSSGGGSDNQAGGSGADESTIKGSAAEGVADEKNLKEKGDWGLLDQRAEAKARELIRQQFPSNYLDAISRYTKKLAEQKK